MTATTHLEMHREHGQWMSEHVQWRHDIASWQREVQQALDDLPKLEGALREHEKTLQTHASAVRLYEQELAQHEHALADFERGGAGEELVAMSQGHGREAAKQFEQRADHEARKRNHHVLMARWMLLRDSLIAAERDVPLHIIED